MAQIDNAEILDWVAQGDTSFDSSTEADRALLVDTAIGVTLYERQIEAAEKVIEARHERNAARKLIKQRAASNGESGFAPAAIHGQIEPPVTAAFSPFGLITDRGIDTIGYLQGRLEAANPDLPDAYLRKVRKVITHGLQRAPRVVVTSFGVDFKDKSLSVENLEQCSDVGRRTANAIMRFLNIESPLVESPEQAAAHNHAA